MHKNTIDDYKKGVKTKYEDVKTGAFSSFLVNPSPAELKNLCLLIFDKGLNIQDQEIFERYFDLNDQTSKSKQIANFDVDKLRPISNFLKGKTETSKTINLDVIAILVDYNPRPYKKFIAVNKVEKTAGLAINELILKEGRGANEDIKEVAIFQEFKKKSVSNKISFALILLFVFGAAGYGVKNIFFRDKNCMVWVENHYEAADYDEVKDTAEVRPYNQVLLDNFKKIAVSDTTTFFKNDNVDFPLVWYGKSPNKKKYEYFNQPGLHPETGKTLKPITRYIIDKHILKKE